MAKILILNGPAGSGKDTLGKLLVQSLNKWYGDNVSVNAEFKGALIDIAIKVAGLKQWEWDRMYTRAEKERSQPRLGGLSPREFLIKISEEWVKPVFGDSHFGELALAGVNEARQSYVVFTDGGFIKEAIPLTENHDVTVARLHRDGFDFRGDSRDYINHHEATENGIQVRDYILVDGDPHTTVNELMQDFCEDYNKRMSQVRYKVWGGLHE
ncbi:putative ATP-binding protein [Vibrio phage vB_VpaP_G1]|uniref:ATP-binding protein n=1 Tax=Vibrio phage vB_VpaP_G1 TaxID=2862773 RepID=A0AAE7WU35_9CAUD|nr:deoxynucleoside monophosphate kinase [Vibrio phage vB_VpaP_G1]QYW05835.1 putative ATP-binding protein [Vibrio phage vB_VpaP_G1]